MSIKELYYIVIILIVYFITFSSIKMLSNIRIKRIIRESFIEYYKEVEKECEFLGTLEITIVDNTPCVKVNDTLRNILFKHNKTKSKLEVIEYKEADEYLEYNNFKLIKKIYNLEFEKINISSEQDLEDGDILMIIFNFQYSYLMELYEGGRV